MAQCSATARRTGRQCAKRAIRGSNICLSHGAAAPQVCRVAAQRVALTRAAELLDPDGPEVDPAQVLVAAVRSSAALLGAAEAAVQAEDADADALHALGEAAMLAGRLAKLALDSGIEARLARQAEQAGAMVGAMLTRTVNALELDPAASAAAFRVLRREVEAQRVSLGPYDHLTVAELDVEIARVVRALDEHDQADAIAGFPARLAGALGAALGAVDLSDDQREQAVAAAESWLAADTAERAERQQTRQERASLVQSSAWWTRPPAGNGSGRYGP
jgi:hypothetical protein